MVSDEYSKSCAAN